MKAADALWLAATNLWKNPMRTLLTILGLGVGVAAVVTVITLGTAGQLQVEAEIDKLGVDKVWITPAQGSGSTLDLRSAERITAATGLQVSAAAVVTSAAVIREQTIVTTVMGYDENAAQVQGMTVSSGRNFTRREHQQGSTVALVDETLSDALGGDVLGCRITLGNRSVTVVGVICPVAAQASAGMVILPLATLMDTWTDAAVSQITVSVPRNTKADAVASQALRVLGEGYQATTLQEEIDAARSVIRIFVMVLSCVAAVCMVTGGVGVMNILLVSVRERRHEIGLMKAVGGTSGQVAALFLLEAAAYALLGGVLGLALGLGMIALFGCMIGLAASLQTSVAVSALAAAALLGVLFGAAPALKASGMLPVDALRQQ